MFTLILTAERLVVLTMAAAAIAAVVCLGLALVEGAQSLATYPSAARELRAEAGHHAMLAVYSATAFSVVWLLSGVRSKLL